MKLITLIIMTVALLATPEAAAHHLMEFAMPQTLWQGVLSGLGHPVLGLDHLAFLLLIGLLGARVNMPLMVPATFVGATLVGIILMPFGMLENVIALTLIVGAVSLYFEKMAVVVSMLGLFHGIAFGTAIVGAEPTPIGGYLVGLTLIQLAITYVIAINGNKLLQLKFAPHTCSLGFCIVGGIFLLG